MEYNELNIHIAWIEVGKMNLSMSAILRPYEYLDITLAQFF